MPRWRLSQRSFDQRRRSAPRPRASSLVKFDNDINPVTADYLTGEIDHANKRHYDAVVIELDTPGGLVDSMNKVVKKELDSKVPVVVYIGPEGAGAGSAGVFISEAADVLAMAPQTTIGAATPISDSGNLPSRPTAKGDQLLRSKARALAATHGRNGTWADSAVRKASSRTANEAVRQNIADLQAGPSRRCSRRSTASRRSRRASSCTRKAPRSPP